LSAAIESPSAPTATRGAGLPRILLVVDSLSNNGAVRITVGLARRWSAHGARLVALQQPTGAGLATPGVTVEQLMGDSTRLRSGLAGAVLQLARLSRRADVVVGGSEIGPALLLGFAVARLTRRRFIVSVHADLEPALAEWTPRRVHPVIRWVHRHVDGAICISEGVAAPIERNGLPATRIRVVRNGIDTAEVTRAAAEPVDLLPDGLPVVVATGRLAPQKGCDVLLRAHAEVVGRHPHRVLVLNEGPELAALQALAGELGVQDSVLFAGATDRPLPHVARADVFCLPSRHEGLPLALLEALSLGVPVIATDSSPGVREALDHGRVGEIVPVDDVGALAGALERHLVDPAPLRARAAQGPEHMRSYDIQAMADGWAAAVVDLLDQPRRPRRRLVPRRSRLRGARRG
jgi:glycosyltransferase involved in cell wall biosynthesis